MVVELNESQTRSLLINPQLLAAGWKLADRSLVRFEIPVDGYDVESEQSLVAIKDCIQRWHRGQPTGLDGELPLTMTAGN